MERGEPVSTPEPTIPPKPKRRNNSIAAQIDVLNYAAKGLTQREIARITGISQQTVCAICQRHQPTTHHALKVLQANAYQAAQDWVKSFKPAVRRGEHRPMRDALIATGVIAADPQTHGITVIVGTGDVSIRETTEAKVLDIPSHNPSSHTLKPHEPI